jgi:hypothetical protein
MRAVRRPSSRPLEGGEGKWVVCSVNARRRTPPHRPLGRNGQELEKVLATNLFERVGDEWLLIQHQVSAVMG